MVRLCFLLLTARRPGAYTEVVDGRSVTKLILILFSLVLIVTFVVFPLPLSESAAFISLFAVLWLLQRAAKPFKLILLVSSESPRSPPVE